MPTFTARFDDPVFLDALDYLRGPPPGTLAPLDRARPSRTDVLRRLVFAAAGSPPFDAPYPTAPPPPPFPAFLDAWAALCVQLGRPCATALEAVTAAPPALRKALLELGHPDALRGVSALGQVLRVLRERAAPDGRRFSRSSGGGANGRSIWYVTGGA
jgi:hypothetical protein